MVSHRARFPTCGPPANHPTTTPRQRLHARPLRPDSPIPIPDSPNPSPTNWNAACMTQG
ncbi:hypothetical protein XHC_2252 [Xanthomonas hortorum pv. carotae str. M081]|nr:hypothetical protein XHC_2252 [Xanthomonas hortorum pv. carotae str. M081]